MAIGARNEQEVREIVKPRTEKRDYRRIILHSALENCCEIPAEYSSLQEAVKRCGHYKKLAPEYEKLGASFKKGGLQ